VRRFALQTAQSLRENWFVLSMNPWTGDGATCYGDSGGPHCLGGRPATSSSHHDHRRRDVGKTYRLDSASARAFLAEFVTLP
jgi:hypothetical protein